MYTPLQAALETQQPLAYLILVAFGAGVLVSFTPCVYPMIPITVGLLQAQTSKSIWKNFFVSLCYVLGIATTYAVLGYVVATTSLIFGQWFASPWFIAFAVAFFIYFAFSMFGFYDIYIPSFLTQRSKVNIGGPYISSYIFGILSGTVASPCLSPALAVVLGYVAKLAQPIAGFLILFSFSLGMGLLLLAIGTFSGMINLLPRAGTWMMEVKKLFGFLLLAVGVYIMQPLFLAGWDYVLYSTICLSASIYYFISARR